jgi:hypothetical protein
MQTIRFALTMHFFQIKSKKDNCGVIREFGSQLSEQPSNTGNASTLRELQYCCLYSIVGFDRKESVSRSHNVLLPFSRLAEMAKQRISFRMPSF